MRVAAIARVASRACVAAEGRAGEPAGARQSSCAAGVAARDPDARLTTVGTPKFAVGDRVEARFEGKATYYAGNITEVTGSTYSIAYDDGDHESNVAEDLIRVYTKQDRIIRRTTSRRSIAESVGGAPPPSTRRSPHRDSRTTMKTAPRFD